MKTLLQKTLGCRVHGVWFVLACLLAVSLLTGAILLANDVSWLMDRTCERMVHPAPTGQHPGSLTLTNAVTSR
jgi:hypothetical protein